jgi:hypothetical protein
MSRPRLLPLVTSLLVLGAGPMVLLWCSGDVAWGQGNEPDPQLSTVPTVVYEPGGGLAYTVSVQSPIGPVIGDTVRIVFSAEADQLVCWCPGQVHPVITGVTGTTGRVTFNIAAAGCIDPDRVSHPPAIQVFSGSVLLAERGGVSPSAVDRLGRLPTSGWDESGSCTAGVSDAVFHTGPLQTGLYEFCTDIVPDGTIDIADYAILSGFIASGTVCP